VAVLAVGGGGGRLPQAFPGQNRHPPLGCHCNSGVSSQFGRGIHAIARTEWALASRLRSSRDLVLRKTDISQSNTDSSQSQTDISQFYLMMSLILLEGMPGPGVSSPPPVRFAIDPWIATVTQG
jgi:hypothetical protein